MNNQTLIILDFRILCEILKEIDNYINFDLICVKKLSEIDLGNEGVKLLIFFK